jgi:hypothetical protein
MMYIAHGPGWPLLAAGEGVGGDVLHQFAT